MSLNPTGGGLYDATQGANLGPAGSVGGMVFVAAEAKGVKPDEAEQKLKPLLQKNIREYVKQIDEAGDTLHDPARR